MPRIIASHCCRFAREPVDWGSHPPPGVLDFHMADILLGHAYFLKYDIIERRVMKPYPPLGILYLSAYLKRVGFNVEVFDSTFKDFDNFEAAVRTCRPRIVGLY